MKKKAAKYAHVYPWQCISLVRDLTTFDLAITNRHQMLVFIHVLSHLIYKFDQI